MTFHIHLNHHNPAVCGGEVKAGLHAKVSLKAYHYHPVDFDSKISLGTKHISLGNSTNIHIDSNNVIYDNNSSIEVCPTSNINIGM